MISKILFGFAVLLAGASAGTDIAYCRIHSTASTAPGNGKFLPKDIDQTLCTHISYIAVTVAFDGSLKIKNPVENLDNDGFKKIRDLKTTAPNLKLILATEGWFDASLYISRMAQVPAARAAFVQNVVNLVLSIGFDGFDLDWEYPNDRGSIPADKVNYVTLLNELRTEFDKKSLILFTTVSGESSYIGPSYDVPKITSAAHYTIVSAHYFTWVWDGVAVFDNNLNNSPIYTTKNAKTLNVKSSMNAWVTAGANSSKLLMDVGFDGQVFTLEDPNSHDVGSCTIGPGKIGPYSNFQGYLGYNEICEMKLNSTWTSVWSEPEQAEYMYQGNQWIAHETERALKLKAQFAKDIGLAGMSFIAINTDDFKGICGPKYPLLKAVRSILFGTIAPVKIKITVDLK